MRIIEHCASARGAVTCAKESGSTLSGACWLSSVAAEKKRKETQHTKARTQKRKQHQRKCCLRTNLTKTLIHFQETLQRQALSAAYGKIPRSVSKHAHRHRERECRTAARVMTIAAVSHTRNDEASHIFLLGQGARGSLHGVHVTVLAWRWGPRAPRVGCSDLGARPNKAQDSSHKTLLATTMIQDQPTQ